MDATQSAANGYPLSRVEDGAPPIQPCGAHYSDETDFHVCTRPTGHDGEHVCTWHLVGWSATDG